MRSSPPRRCGHSLRTSSGSAGFAGVAAASREEARVAAQPSDWCLDRTMRSSSQPWWKPELCFGDASIWEWSSASIDGLTYGFPQGPQDDGWLFERGGQLPRLLHDHACLTTPVGHGRPGGCRDGVRSCYPRPAAGKGLRTAPPAGVLCGAAIDMSRTAMRWARIAASGWSRLSLAGIADGKGRRTTSAVDAMMQAGSSGPANHGDHGPSPRHASAGELGRWRDVDLRREATRPTHATGFLGASWGQPRCPFGSLRAGRVPSRPRCRAPTGPEWTADFRW